MNTRTKQSVGQSFLVPKGLVSPLRADPALGSFFVV